MSRIRRNASSDARQVLAVWSDTDVAFPYRHVDFLRADLPICNSVVGNVERPGRKNVGLIRGSIARAGEGGRNRAAVRIATLTDRLPKGKQTYKLPRPALTVAAVRRLRFSPNEQARAWRLGGGTCGRRDIAGLTAKALT